jgi:hypothetical protein
MGPVRNRLAFDFERIIRPIPSYGQVWCEREREGSWQTVGEEGEKKGDQQPTPRTRRPSGPGICLTTPRLFLNRTAPEYPSQTGDGYQPPPQNGRMLVIGVLGAKVSCSSGQEQLTRLIPDPFSAIRIFETDDCFKTRLQVNIVTECASVSIPLRYHGPLINSEAHSRPPSSETL